MNKSPETGRALLFDMFKAAVDAALPRVCVPPNLPPAPSGRTVVLGAGKAAAAMAKAVEEHWPGPIDGLVVTRYGHRVPTERIEVVEAAHPVPDLAGRQAAERLLELARQLGPDDLALCLISGGGSSLLTLPAPGLTLEDKQAITNSLLRCGATIDEINCVRKHLSAIKGGRLAAAVAPAHVVTLAISDVPGDDPAVIASGPTVPDPTTFADARAVLAKYRIDAPEPVLEILERARDESPKPGDPAFANADLKIVARPAGSLAAAARVAERGGYRPIVLGDDLEGEARELAADHGRLALRHLADGEPMALISGGETTVTMTGKGRGGRNSEYLLALALALDGADGIQAIACDTDGIDGSEDNAGAVIDSATLSRAREHDLDAAASLRDNDAYTFFSALNDLVVTGPTFTNVNDFRAILIGGSK